MSHIEKPTARKFATHKRTRDGKRETLRRKTIRAEKYATIPTPNER